MAISSTDREIMSGMSRALFVSAWADYEEERGRSHSGQDLMHAAPATPSQARTAARVLAKRTVQANGKSLSELYYDAIAAGGSGTANIFGHYLAMQALGHGVSWFDDNPEFPINIPHIEFAKVGSKDYFYPRT